MRYKVIYKSKAGPVAQYSGEWYVNAENEGEAINKAYKHISDSFPDRSFGMWNFDVQKSS